MGVFDRYYFLYNDRRRPRLNGQARVEVSKRMKPPKPIEPCYLWGMHQWPQFMLVYYKRKKDKRITNEDCLEHFKGLPRWPVKQE